MLFWGLPAAAPPPTHQSLKPLHPTPPPQIACMAYQLFLVRSVNVQHMKRFSVFLALPSATIRIMAARHMVVSLGFWADWA